VRSTETESKAANQGTKGTFLHEANPLFTPIGLFGGVDAKRWVET
jgi:hypothetical protein